MADELNKRFKDQKFLPVFWMASEDHDFNEISSVKIFNDKIKIDGENKGPVGRLKTKELSSSIK